MNKKYLQKTDYTKIPDAELATAVLAELKWHQEQDNLCKGTYWNSVEGKGCAVGCLLKGSGHDEFPDAFGIPIMLAWLEEEIFESLPVEASKQWPLNFMTTVLSVGKIRKQRLQLLEPVGWKFLYWLLVDELRASVATRGKVTVLITQCAKVLAPLTKGKKLTEKQIADTNVAKAAAHDFLVAHGFHNASAYGESVVDDDFAAATTARAVFTVATVAAYSNAYVTNMVGFAVSYAARAFDDATAFYERAAAKLVKLIEEANRE